MNRTSTNADPSVSDPARAEGESSGRTLGASLDHLKSTSLQTSGERQVAQDLARARELAEMISDLQTDLSEIHRALGERYQPDLESQGSRITIERDEAIISWGQALLGLSAAGARVEVVTPDRERYVLLGHAQDREINPPSAVATTSSQAKQSSTPTRVPLVAKVERPQDLQESIDDEQDDGSPLSDIDDPGVAEAPKISLAQFSLEELRQQMLKPKGWSQDEVDADEDAEEEEQANRQYAIEVVTRIGAPRNLNTQELKEHLIELESEVDCCQRWGNFTQSIQHAVVTLVTSRLRNIQDHIGSNPFDQERIAKMFRRLTRFSSDFRPGFVHGLARDKVPEFESWQVDEQNAWARLEDYLDLKPQLPKLSPERLQKLDALKELIKREAELPNFSNDLRAAVTDCINSGFPQDSPHLAAVLESHLSHLSGKRFKKLRLAAGR